LKKAECIISVFKDEGDPMVSKVECTDIRGTAEFKDFNIEIQDNGVPIVQHNNSFKDFTAKEIDF
jgi:phosphopantetheinyl transferase (holo-ACP synthase)